MVDTEEQYEVSARVQMRHGHRIVLRLKLVREKTF